MTVTILLADDHHLVRQGIRSVLETNSEFVVVGEASDGWQTMELVESLKPDVTIIDITMPGLNGLEVTRQVHEKTKVIILSMHANEAYVLEALHHGAYGYVLKESTATDLIRAVQKVADGQRFLSAPFSDHVLQTYLTRSQTSPLDPYETLTRREREVLQLMAEGWSTTEISERLYISPRTVEVHRANVMHKLDLHTQTDLVRYAIRRGLIAVDR
ncbi:MAG TPA: response regulator transcription factor [Anaerolineaceae bacterium]|nr:response regulator transcription factor [Anaerolineaceae bacterium]